MRLRETADRLGGGYGNWEAGRGGKCHLSSSVRAHFVGILEELRAAGDDGEERLVAVLPVRGLEREASMAWASATPGFERRCMAHLALDKATLDVHPRELNHVGPAGRTVEPIGLGLARDSGPKGRHPGAEGAGPAPAHSGFSPVTGLSTTHLMSTSSLAASKSFTTALGPSSSAPSAAAFLFALALACAQRHELQEIRICFARYAVCNRCWAQGQSRPR